MAGGRTTGMKSTEGGLQKNAGADVHGSDCPGRFSQRPCSRSFTIIRSRTYEGRASAFNSKLQTISYLIRITREFPNINTTQIKIGLTCCCFLFFPPLFSSFVYIRPSGCVLHFAFSDNRRHSDTPPSQSI